MRIIGYALLCFFCAYGFIQLLFYILDIIFESKQLKHKKVYTVVFVKDEEDTVENTVRALLWKAVKNDTGVADSEIAVIDLGSSDHTVEVLKRMEMENSAIRLRTIRELENRAEYEIAHQRN